MLRLLAWMAIAVVGVAGYLTMRASAAAIANDGRVYLLPGLLVAGVALAAGLVCLWTAPLRGPAAAVELGLVLLAGVAFRALLVGLPPMFSHDAYRYVWDAQLVAHGVSPWQHTVVDPVLAPLRDGAIWPLVN